MRGLFRKFKTGLQRTTPTFYRAFSQAGGLFGSRKLDAASIEELEEALYSADFGVATTEEILREVQAAVRSNRELRGLDAARIGAEVLRSVLAGAEVPLELGRNRPEVIALIGVNGSGKTTTAAKLGRYFKDEGRSILLGACDTFRAAANEQIVIWAQRLDVPLISSHHGADSASVAFDAYQAARSREMEVLILDTAGRLHTKGNLMEELKKIRRVLQKQNEDAPHHSWLVLDGSIGSNSIDQARAFHREFSLTGLIITKLDGTSRGGALVGIYRELRLPILFVGLGEGEHDLQPFSVDHYARAVFGLEAPDPDAG